MALIRVKGQQTLAVSSQGEGGDVFLRATRDGALFNADWFMGQSLAGTCYGVNTGIMTTPVTFSPVVADTMPDVLVGVPTGTTIIPTYISVCFEDTGTVLAIDTFAVVAPTYDVTLTGTELTVMNLRVDKPKSSLCTSYGTVTANGPTFESGNFIEFWRPYGGLQEDAFNGSTNWVHQNVAGSIWTVRKAVVPPICVGPASLGVFAGAQAGTGFITVTWIELPTASLA